MVWGWMGPFNSPPMSCYQFLIETYGLSLTVCELFSWPQKRLRPSVRPPVSPSDTNTITNHRYRSYHFVERQKCTYISRMSIVNKCMTFHINLNQKDAPSVCRRSSRQWLSGRSMTTHIQWRLYTQRSGGHWGHTIRRAARIAVPVIPRLLPVIFCKKNIITLVSCRDLKTGFRNQLWRPLSAKIPHKVFLVNNKANRVVGFVQQRFPPLIFN